MGQHQVTFLLPERRLGKSDIEIKVRRNGLLLGRVLVSKGAVEWVPRQKQHKYKASWTKFSQLLEDYGRKIPKT